MASVVDYQDDFNSSDFEFEPALNPYASAGAKCVEALLEDVPNLRWATKKVVKEMVPDSGAPGTRQDRARWANTWEAFVTKVLKKNINSMPTNEDIERFLVASGITKQKLSPRRAVSSRYIASGLQYTLHSIRCRHSDFRPTYDERERVKAVLETLRQKGITTREPTREKQWVTAQLVAQLTRSLLVDAVTHGTLDWSVTVQKCLALSLQSALSCRAGDMIVSQGYEDNECLLFKHVQLRVIANTPVTHEGPLIALLDRITIRGKVILAHTKGSKRDGSNNHIVALDSLDDVTFNVCDPIKLLLVHALRQGGIKFAVTAEDAIRNALARDDGLILWEFPERPVLCALTRQRTIDYNKGAGRDMLGSTITEAARLLGITANLVPHDIRRGAARDAATLGSKFDMVAAQHALGHNGAALYHGVTQDYVGHVTISTWNERLRIIDNDVSRLQAVNIGIGSKSKRRPLPLTTAEIDDFATRPENANFTRAWVRMRLRKVQKVEFAKSLSTPTSHDGSSIQPAVALSDDRALRDTEEATQKLDAPQSVFLHWLSRMGEADAVAKAAVAASKAASKVARRAALDTETSGRAFHDTEPVTEKVAIAHGIVLKAARAAQSANRATASADESVAAAQAILVKAASVAQAAVAAGQFAVAEAAVHAGRAVLPHFDSATTAAAAAKDAAVAGRVALSKAIAAENEAIATQSAAVARTSRANMVPSPPITVIDLTVD